MTINERIFKIMRELSMSQKEFSEKTGIAQSTISDWKTKKLNPASDKIMVICDALKVSPYELLSGSEGENYKALEYIIVDKGSKEYSLIEKYQKLDGMKQERLFGYLSALVDEIDK